MPGRKARSAVFAPEVSGIRAFLAAKTWMAGTSPAMTADDP